MQKPNKVSTVSPTAHVATNATVIGDVTISDECCVLFNATIRGDCDGFVRLGERTNVQEGACLHVSHGSPTIIGHDVTIGHAAVVHLSLIHIFAHAVGLNLYHAAIAHRAGKRAHAATVTLVIGTCLSLIHISSSPGQSDVLRLPLPCA